MEQAGIGLGAVSTREILDGIDAMRGSPPVRDPRTGVWHALSHASVERVLTDHAVFSSEGVGTRPIDELRDEDMLFMRTIVGMDPPRHRRYRSVVSAVFTPRAVASLEGRIREISQELIDRVRPAGRMDFIEDFAFPLPVAVIAEMLGVPLDRREDFRRWSDDLLSAGFGLDRANPPERQRAASRDMMAYFDELVEERRRRPKEDLISGLVQAEVDGQRLDRKELSSFCILLLLAGHVTTTTLLAQAVWCLDDPETAGELRRSPELVPDAIEEVLRHRTPVLGLGRIARQDVTLEGQAIRRGEVVLAWIWAANHDPTVFRDPDRFDPHRKPNPHLAFGHGIHFCLGAPLSRLEAAVALPMLLEQLPGLRCDPDAPAKPLDGTILHGFRSLPVTFSAVGAVR